jgi:hypothetical protein
VENNEFSNRVSVDGPPDDEPKGQNIADFNKYYLYIIQDSHRSRYGQLTFNGRYGIIYQKTELFRY